tara:strand:- start:100900 stop:101058 length:159 start_codon:yes stop_codon:yes gene_type:complete
VGFLFWYIVLISEAGSPELENMPVAYSVNDGSMPHHNIKATLAVAFLLYCVS